MKQLPPIQRNNLQRGVKHATRNHSDRAVMTHILFARAKSQNQNAINTATQYDSTLHLKKMHKQTLRKCFYRLFTSTPKRKQTKQDLKPEHSKSELQLHQ